MAEKIVKVFISTQKGVTVICDLLSIRHHKGVFYEIISSHCQPLQGGNIMFLALSNMVESTFRCDSESFGVGNLPLRSASSVKILASSPQSSGDVLIVIAIVFISLFLIQIQSYNKFPT